GRNGRTPRGEPAWVKRMPPTVEAVKRSPPARQPVLMLTLLLERLQGRFGERVRDSLTHRELASAAATLGVRTHGELEAVAGAARGGSANGCAQASRTASSRPPRRRSVCAHTASSRPSPAPPSGSPTPAGGPSPRRSSPWSRRVWPCSTSSTQTVSRTRRIRDEGPSDRRRRRNRRADDPVHDAGSA